MTRICTFGVSFQSLCYFVSISRWLHWPADDGVLLSMLSWFIIDRLPTYWKSIIFTWLIQITMRASSSSSPMNILWRLLCGLASWCTDPWWCWCPCWCPWCSWSCLFSYHLDHPSSSLSSSCSSNMILASFALTFPSRSSQMRVYVTIAPLQMCLLYSGDPFFYARLHTRHTSIDPHPTPSHLYHTTRYHARCDMLPAPYRIPSTAHARSIIIYAFT